MIALERDAGRGVKEKEEEGRKVNDEREIKRKRERKRKRDGRTK